MTFDLRDLNTRHALGMLIKFPLVGPGVVDARVALEKATSTLTASRVEEHAKKDAARAASARVRDATKKAFDECRRSRGALVAKDAGLGETLPRGMRVLSARGMLARAAHFLELGTEAGVALPALAAVRDELDGARADAVAARIERKLARAARVRSEEAWDAAFASLRGAVELVLGGRGLRGRRLLDEVQVYFPPRVARHPQDGPAGDTGVETTGTSQASPAEKPAA